MVDVTTHLIRLPVTLTSDQTCVWSHVDMAEHDSLMINERWTFLDDGFVQTFQLQTLHSLKIVWFEKYSKKTKKHVNRS